MLKIRDLGIGFSYLMSDVCNDPSGPRPQCKPSGPPPPCPNPSGGGTGTTQPPPPPCAPSGANPGGGGKHTSALGADAIALLKQQMHRRIGARL